jgi:hypothetical protein
MNEYNIEKLAREAYKKHSVEDDRLSLDEQIQRSGGFIVGFKEGFITAKSFNDIDYIHNLLTYDDLDEDVKIQRVIEYIKSLKEKGI